MSEGGTPTRGRDAGVTVRSAAAGEVDGRSARRDRNRIAVLDAAIALFAEGNLQPSPGEVAARCGVSHRSINRYFPDGRMMLRAAVDRQVEVGVPLYRLHAIGRGPLAGRIDDFVQVRLAGHAALGATARAATLLAATSRIVRSELAVVRDLMSDQVERQFAPELDALAGEHRAATQFAVEALFQFESLDYYLRQRELSVEEARRLLVVALTRLLDRG
jgi:AcrR family transcriptional regulator